MKIFSRYFGWKYFDWLTCCSWHWGEVFLSWEECVAASRSQSRCGRPTVRDYWNKGGLHFTTIFLVEGNREGLFYFTSFTTRWTLLTNINGILDSVVCVQFLKAKLFYFLKSEFGWTSQTFSFLPRHINWDLPF